MELLSVMAPDGPPTDAYIGGFTLASRPERPDGALFPGWRPEPLPLESAAPLERDVRLASAATPERDARLASPRAEPPAVTGCEEPIPSPSPRSTRILAEFRAELEAPARDLPAFTLL